MAAAAGLQLSSSQLSACARHRLLLTDALCFAAMPRATPLTHRQELQTEGERQKLLSSAQLRTSPRLILTFFFLSSLLFSRCSASGSCCL